MINQNHKYNIKTLLHNHIVEIPAIQRDYAFGRLDAITSSISKNRLKFLRQLIETRIHQDKTLHLDFIYGKSKENVFIPLDGQQRITTLWLIEVYLYHCKKEISNDTLERDFITKFTYATRTSSREFCEALVCEEWNLTNVDNGKVKDYFTQQKWFFNTWHHDPTIKGMLNIMDYIHSELHKVEKINGSASNITFSFLNIDALKEPEELYIKMNSRGKQLSPWDNFKADLFKIIEDKDINKSVLTPFNEIIIEEGFIQWVEGSLLDYFWKLDDIEETRVVETEARMHWFFLMMIFIQRMEDHNNIEAHTELTVLFNDTSDLEDIITETFITNLIRVCLFIKKHRDEISEVECPRFEDEGLRLPELIKYILEESQQENIFAKFEVIYSYYKFATVHYEDKELDIDELIDVIRITTNFEETYRKQFEAELQYVRSMGKGISHEDGIIDFFATLRQRSNNAISFGAYSEEQLQEEIEKALLIKDSEDWRSQIYRAESHPYFNGIIGWLLKMAGAENGEINPEQFTKYIDFMNEKFNSEGITDKREIANILKYYDIRLALGVGNHKIFPRNSNSKDAASNLERDKSWKKVMRNHGCTQKSGDLEWLRKWFLNRDYDEVDDWRSWFIEFDLLLDINCGNIGGVDNRGDNQTVILGNKWNVEGFNSIKYEIPLYVLSLYIEDIKYEGSSNMLERPKAFYNDIEIEYKKDGYNISKQGESIRIEALDKQNILQKICVALNIEDDDVVN